jgi:hypothetical protein
VRLFGDGALGGQPFHRAGAVEAGAVFRAPQQVLRVLCVTTGRTSLAMSFTMSLALP